MSRRRRWCGLACGILAVVTFAVPIAPAEGHFWYHGAWATWWGTGGGSCSGTRDLGYGEPSWYGWPSYWGFGSHATTGGPSVTCYGTYTRIYDNSMAVLYEGPGMPVSSAAHKPGGHYFRSGHMGCPGLFNCAADFITDDF